MKKIILFSVIVFLLFAGFSYAGCSLQLGGIKDVGSACNPATDYAGDKTQRTFAVNLTANDAKCNTYTASCTGTWGYGYTVHKAGVGTDYAKISIYLAADRSLVVQSGTITAAEADAEYDGGWYTTSSKLGGSAVNGTSYLVCIVSSSSNIWTTGMSTSGGDGAVQTVLEAGYTTAVDPLPAADSTDNDAELSLWVEIE